MKKFPIFNVDLINCKIKQTKIFETCKFASFDPNFHVISEVIHWYKAKKRTAFPSALSKGKVKGSGKKPFPQKGKGMARQGFLKNPHQRGGGVAFPPNGKIFAYKINKKKIKLALKSIFFTRLLEGRIIILDNLTLKEPSTPTMNNLLKVFNFKKTLFIDEYNENLELSIRNISHAKFIPYSSLNAYDLTLHPHIILTKNVFQTFLFSHFY